MVWLFQTKYLLHLVQPTNKNLQIVSFSSLAKVLLKSFPILLQEQTETLCFLLKL